MQTVDTQRRDGSASHPRAPAWDEQHTERVAALYLHTPNILIFVFVASTALLLYCGAGHWLQTLVWWGVMQLIAVYRLGIYLLWKRLPPEGRDAPRLLNLFAAGTLATGLAWAWFSLAIFPYALPDQRTLIALIVAIMAAGSVVVLSLVRWLNTAYLLLLILPMVATLLHSRDPDDLLLGGLGVVMFLGLSGFSRVARENAQRSLATQRDHALRASRAMAAQQALSHQMNWLSSRDPLTQLLNREHMTAELQRVAQATQTGDQAWACLCVRILRFDVIELQGQSLGARVLGTLAERLRQTLPEHSLMSRWTHDSFMLAVPLETRMAGSVEALRTSAEQLRQTLRSPIALESGLLSLDFMLGCSNLPGLAHNADELIYQTAAALHHLRELNMGGVRVFDPQHDNKPRERQDLRQALLQALNDDVLQLAFQPIEPAVNSRPRKREALLRWTHPQRGPVSPADFIPIAEESGLIVPIGNWVLQRACSIAVTWPGDTVVCVNVSVQQFLASDLCVTVMNALQDSGLSPRRLELEVTESVFAHDLEHICATLEALRELGVSVAIDDFGTGYSSLAYIRRLPVDSIKIDRSFVADVDSSGRKLLFAIVTMARGLGFHVVAEGVETPQQRELLLALGVDYLQGYLIGKPLPDATSRAG